MALQDQLSGILGGLFGGLAVAGVVILIVIILVGVIGGLIFYIYRRKITYNIVAKVISRRSGQNSTFFDKAAILHDRKNNVRYMRLYNTKVDLELPNFIVLSKTNWGDYVEILRESERGFRFLTPPKIDNQHFVKKDGKLYPMASMKHRQLESDASFVLQRERQNKRMINPESIVMKILEHLPQILSGVLSLMIIWVVFKYAPEWLSAMESFVNAINSNNAPQIVGSILPLGILRWKKKI